MTNIAPETGMRWARTWETSVENLTPAKCGYLFDIRRTFVATHRVLLVKSACFPLLSMDMIQVSSRRVSGNNRSSSLDNLYSSADILSRLESIDEGKKLKR